MATAAPSDPATRYNAGARAFHAVIAALVIANLILGIGHDAFEGTVFGMSLHKSIGLTVLFLSLARLAWRFTWTPPPYNPPLKPFDLKLAKAVHWLFYALIVIIPLSGWMMVSAGTRPLAWFGIPFAKLPVERGSTLAEVAHEGHELLGFLMLALVVLHVAAALRHHYMLRDGVLRRIW